MTKKDVLQSVDAESRRAAKTLIREARFAALAVADPVKGYPMASRIAVATASDGAPVFLISQLSGHFGALEADGRASVLVGEPGRGDPLAHSRVTVFGHAAKIEGADRALIRARFLARHPKAALYVDFADFAFWRLTPEGASFNGGFGKAYEMQPDDLLAPVDEALEAMEAGAVEHMNEDHADAIAGYASALLGLRDGPWSLACLDLEGLDLISGDKVARLWFDPPLPDADALRPRLVSLAKDARGERI